MADEQKGTAYVVLRQATHAVTVKPQDDEPADAPVHNMFVVVAKDDEPLIFTAANDIAAIKAAEKLLDTKFHGAVAVPVRSWRPRAPEDKMVPQRLWT